MKYFVFSIDDGTVFDKEVIALINKYGFKATFNLNSGLEDFTWYLDNTPITRLNLHENKQIYNGHEIASHSLTHPYLDSCDEGRVIYEVSQDTDNLENIFSKEIIGFATPFETAGEREVEIIKNNTKAKYIRLSQIDTSFKLPNDPYHIRCTSITIDDALNLIDDFFNNEEAELFVSVFHSYDLFTSSSLSKLEELLIKLDKNRDFVKVIPLKDVIDLIG